MAQILFVQGGGPGAHDAWDNKLVASLQAKLGPGFAVLYPRMPNEALPKYAAWKSRLEREFDALGDGAFLVGHSIGATILIHTLAETPRTKGIGGVFLIAAPYVGDGGWPSDEIAPKQDLGAALADGVAVFLYHGERDETAPIAHVGLYAKAIPQARVRRLAGRDHQLNDDLSEVADDLKRLSAAGTPPPSED
jgi:pimeloyl-ACP methyl ester carboxylesterase